MEHPQERPTGHVVPGRTLVPHFDLALRAGVVRNLVPHLPAGVAPSAVRQAFVAELVRTSAACWQDAWDEMVERRGGRITLECDRCEACNGRRFDARRASWCHRCAATGRHRHQVEVPARRAPRP
jgi:hypothetical protein